MNLKNLFPLTSGNLLALSLIGSVISGLTANLYGPVGISNPFFILCYYLLLVVLVLVLTDNFEERSTAQFQRMLVAGPLRLTTACVLIGFAIPENVVWRFPVIVIAGWMVISSIKAVAPVFAQLWDEVSVTFTNTIDQRSFRKHMKEVAETARIEERLSSDLKSFIMGTDSSSQGKK